MKAAVGSWVRNEIGRRWKALVALGVLAGLVGGLPMAAVAGARRSSTAYERFRESTGRFDALIFGPPVAATVVLLSIPAALVLANAMAALPARRAARLQPADVLRAE